MDLASSPVTFLLLGLTILVSWQAWTRLELFEKLLHSPWRIRQYREYYRILTHALVHGDGTHLIFNMLGLYMFGRYVERVFTHGAVVMPGVVNWNATTGMLCYLVLYIGGIAAGVLPSLRTHRDNPAYRSVGASGGVSALLMAFAILNPTAEMTFLFLPFFSLPAFVWIFIFFGLEHYLSRRGGTGIAHDAHIYGALFGIAFVVVVNPRFISQFFYAVSTYFQ